MGIVKNNDTFKIVNDIKSYVNNLLLQGEPTFVAMKKGDTRVIARPGIVGEQIATYTKDGNGNRCETISTVQEGMWVVTMADKNGNPIPIDNEGHFNTYTNTAKEFQKYQPTDTPGVYKQIPEEIIFVEVHEDIRFMAPWGSMENLKAGGVINVTNMDNLYGIARYEFDTTHEIVDKTKENDVDTKEINDLE
jgi:hypothetical protein